MPNTLPIYYGTYAHSYPYVARWSSLSYGSPRRLAYIHPRSLVLCFLFVFNNKDHYVLGNIGAVSQTPTQLPRRLSSSSSLSSKSSSTRCHVAIFVNSRLAFVVDTCYLVVSSSSLTTGANVVVFVSSSTRSSSLQSLLVVLRALPFRLPFPRRHARSSRPTRFSSSCARFPSDLLLVVLRALPFRLASRRPARASLPTRFSTSSRALFPADSLISSSCACPRPTRSSR
ncbi:Uncharacterised protein [Candidatus Norongarragalina meridionalis]|nr:Uncharacterised protein [Candidatus Norongarragalina meridionalis]